MMKVFYCIFTFLFCAGMVSAGEKELSRAGTQGTAGLAKYAIKLEKEKKYEEAILVYKEIIASEKNIPEIQNFLIKSAKGKMKINDFGGAVHDLEQVLAMKKSSLKKSLKHCETAVMELAAIYSSRMKNYSGALLLLDKAVSDKDFSTAAIKKFSRKKEILLQEEVNTLVRLKKFDAARKKAAENRKKMPGSATVKSVINTETAYAKMLTGRKKYSEANIVLQEAAKIKGASPKEYWSIQEAHFLNELAARKFDAAKAALDKLAKMPGGNRNTLVMLKVRMLFISGKDREMVELLVKNANDSRFTEKEQGKFYAEAAFYAVSRLKNIKLSEEYYAKAKARYGKNYRNTRVEKSLAYWKNKL